MADETEVVVPEEGVIEVPVEGVAGEPEPEKKVEAAAEVPKEPKKPEPQPRVRTREATPADDAAKTLQVTLDNERRMRQAAEQTALSERQRAEQAAGRLQERETELETQRQNAHAQELSRIDNDIATTTSLIASTQKELAGALAEGNFEKVAEVQTRLGKAAAALDRFEARKADFESRPPTAPVTEGRVTDQGTQPAPNTTEAYISRMEPAAQTWLRAHPECVPGNVGGNEEMNSKMMAGHYLALSKLGRAGVNSPDYFRIIEESCGFRQPEVAKVQNDEDEEVVDTKPKQEQQPKREARPSAPPSREPPGSPQTGGTRTVRLSKEEQETAKFSFPNLEPAKAFAEYAKNKVQLAAEGKLGRTSH